MEAASKNSSTSGTESRDRFTTGAGNQNWSRIRTDNCRTSVERSSDNGPVAKSSETEHAACNKRIKYLDHLQIRSNDYKNSRNFFLPFMTESPSDGSEIKVVPAEDPMIADGPAIDPLTRVEPATAPETTVPPAIGPTTEAAPRWGPAMVAPPITGPAKPRPRPTPPKPRIPLGAAEATATTATITIYQRDSKIINVSIHRKRCELFFKIFFRIKTFYSPRISFFYEFCADVQLL